MVLIEAEFREKISHINLYFDLLERILNQEAELKINEDIYSFDQDLTKVLKANVFLLLYNLIESTVRKSTEFIHENVNAENIQYHELKKEIQRIWIEFKYNNFKDHSSTQIHDALSSITSEIVSINYEKYINKRKANDLSGNIDALSIRTLAEKYGFNENVRVHGNRLVQIKNRRNNLAHGNITFAECGKDYTYSDLKNFKRETEFFLVEFLKNVKKFVENQTYKQ